jgi:hypothetical protein
MTAAPAADPPIRRSWKYKEAAQSFRESHGDPFYTMVWNEQFDALMDDASVKLHTRGVAYMLRFTQGNLSDVAIDRMPVVDDRDQPPRRCDQTHMAERIRCSASAASGLVRTFREQGILLPDTAGFYINPRVQPTLFASQRQNGGVSPLDTSATSGVENPLQTFEEWSEGWLAEHPEHVAKRESIAQEMARLKDLEEEQRYQKRKLDLERFGEYRDYKRSVEKAMRNGASHSTNGQVHGVETDSTPEPAAAAPVDFGSTEEKVRDSTSQIGPKSSVFNEAADISSKEKTVHSSSSGSSATDSATTTTTDQTPPTPEPAAKTDSATPGVEEAAPPEDLTPQLMTDVEFHRALSVAFRTAGKPVPTPEQSVACYVGVGAPAAPRFLGWLERPYRSGERPLPPKLPGVQHPGVLKALVAEFESWCAAEPPPPPAPPPPKPVCSFCGGSGFPGASCNTLPEARDLIAAGIGPCVCEIGKLWREMLE